jgi:hypothetical protein
MTFEDRQALNATLLWINLKTGILPNGAAITPARDENPMDGKDISRAGRGEEQPSRAFKAASFSMPTKRGQQRLSESNDSSGRHIFRLFSRLRLVWSHPEKSSWRGTNEH